MADEENTETTDESTETADNTNPDTTSEDNGSTQEPSGKADTKGTLAGGENADDGGKPEDAPYWPDDWREKAAEHLSAGDSKAYKKELTRLKRINDPSAMWGMYRELEGKFTSGNLVKKPGDDATEEEIAAYRKQMGVPDDPDDYFDSYDSKDTPDLDDSDVEVIGGMVEALHIAGASVEAVHSVLDWYFDKMEETSETRIEEDDKFRYEAEKELKEELGPAYKRTLNGVKHLFAQAPGGADINNEGSLYSRLMGGRTADGRLIGNDPDMVRWLASLNQEVNPMLTVMDTTTTGGRSVQERKAEIEKMMREDRKGYSKNEAVQEEYRRILDAELRAKARA